MKALEKPPGFLPKGELTIAKRCGVGIRCARTPSPEGTGERRHFGARTRRHQVTNGKPRRGFQFFQRVLLCILSVLASAYLSGCSQKSSAADKKTNGSLVVPVVVTQAIAQDFPIELRNIGNVEAYATVTIRSQITGQITKIHFREGQEVKAGDMLFTIDPRPAQGALRQAQADLKRDQAQLVSARLEFDRARKLFESKISSKDDYDKAEAAYGALEATVMADEAQVSRAQLQVEFTSIRSPIDGRTGNLMVKQGNIVKAPDDSLVTINQVHPIYVTFSVPEQELPPIRERMQAAALPVEVDAPGSTGLKLKGELSFIDNTVDMTTGRIRLKATFENADGLLWPGQFLQTRLTIRTLAHATMVPTQALQSSQSGDFMFVVKEDSKVQKRPVVAGPSRGGMMVVEKGIEPGETVVIDGQLRLVEGSEVKAHNNQL
jgi:membrane fusion protein, multidrug efflux system